MIQSNGHAKSEILDRKPPAKQITKLAAVLDQLHVDADTLAQVRAAVDREPQLLDLFRNAWRARGTDLESVESWLPEFNELLCRVGLSKYRRYVFAALVAVHNRDNQLPGMEAAS